MWEINSLGPLKVVLVSFNIFGEKGAQDLAAIGSKLRSLIKPAGCKDQGLNLLKATVTKHPFLLLSQVYIHQVWVRKLEISAFKKKLENLGNSSGLITERTLDL